MVTATVPTLAALIGSAMVISTVGTTVSRTIVVVAVPSFPAASSAVAVIAFEPSAKAATTLQVVSVG